MYHPALLIRHHRSEKRKVLVDNLDADNSEKERVSDRRSPRTRGDATLNTHSHKKAFLSTSTPSADSLAICDHVDEIKASVHLMSSLLGFVQRVFSARLSVVVAAPVTSLGVFWCLGGRFDPHLEWWAKAIDDCRRDLRSRGTLSKPGRKEKLPVFFEGFDFATQEYCTQVVSKLKEWFQNLF
jgi:hypothetical protein